MPKETTILTYRFDELCDSAKEYARNQYRDHFWGDDWYEFLIDDFVIVGGFLGIEFSTKAVKLMGGDFRHKPEIYFTGFNNQGDGACFYGEYSYGIGSVEAIKNYASKDVELCRIASELTKVQKPFFYNLEATISRGYSRYSHAYSPTIYVYHAEDEYRELGGAEDCVQQLLRDFMDWMYSKLSSEYTWLTDNEQIDRNFLECGYVFYEDGSRCHR